MSADTLKIKVAGKDMKFLMSYGLLDELSKIVESPELIPTIGLDHDRRSMLVKAVLASRDQDGDIISDKLPEMAVPEVVKIVEWASGHVLDFFLTLLESTRAISETSKEKMTKLMSSLNGSAASVSENPSPGQPDAS